MKSAIKGKNTFFEVPQPALIVRSAPGVRRLPKCVGELTTDVTQKRYKSAEIDNLRQSGALGPDRSLTGSDRQGVRSRVSL